MKQTLSKLESLANTIRKGLYPDTPILFRQYLDCLDAMAKAELSAMKRTQLYLKSARLFIDTGCDTSLPEYWRKSAIDQVYLPILKLEKMARNEEALPLIASLKNDFRSLKLKFN